VKKGLRFVADFAELNHVPESDGRAPGVRIFGGKDSQAIVRIVMARLDSAIHGF
jgi:hypothetical protein